MSSSISITLPSLIALCLNTDYKLFIILFVKHYAYLQSYLNNLKLSYKTNQRLGESQVMPSYTEGCQKSKDKLNCPKDTEVVFDTHLFLEDKNQEFRDKVWTKN